MKPPGITRCWTFVSSKGDRRYQTLLYADSSTSCDCPGWCRRVAADGTRSCKHTRSVLMGTAHQECETSHDYHVPATAPVSAAMPVHRVIAPVGQFGQLGRRKIQT